ncbi:MAG: efflux RND transporter permease subunit [Lachnospiraceae bacterium]|nr:efflux RND transporter permease subunit [Lachnospiraceae bacterium]
MTKQCIKKPFIIFVAVIICLTLAAVSLTRMGTDLLPEMDMPYMIVVTTYPGASPEKVEADITKPLEGSLASVSNVKNVTSSSAENYGMVMLEFADGTNMDSAMVRVRSAIDAVGLPEDAGAPNIMEISMDMMASQYLAVSYEGKDIYEISDFVSETLTPFIERQEGVASVTELGLVDKYVEVRLDQPSIDVVNGKILDKVSGKMADARQEITDAQAELDSARSEIENGSGSLQSQQNSTAQQLGEASRGLNQALATQAAYQAELASEKANKKALEMELQAYEDANLEEKLAQMDAMFAEIQKSVTGEEAYQQIYNMVYQQVLIQSVQAVADQAGLGIVVTAENVDAVLAQLGAETTAALQSAAAAAAASAAAEQIEALKNQYPTSVADAIANPDKLAAARALLESQGQGEAAAQLTVENLTQITDILNVRIPQIKTGLANLEVEIAASEAVTAEVNKAVSQAMASYSSVEAGKILAAAGFGSAAAQISSGKASIENGQAQLDSALESFEKAQETALKNANVDALLDINTLSGILFAENFAMPAGYVDDKDDNQWMLKIGQAIDSLEELENLVLTNIDGIGDITLKDVARITVLDNAGESYARMNGKDAVLLSVYKNSTASTSDLSYTMKEARAEIEEKYPGLQVSPLLDQGDFIGIFIKNILTSILIGALLAIIILTIFLKDMLPTLVVAFAIPFSVLVAILIMYFTGLSLNIMTMSGLALSIGMLVDNSIVVMENVFRLRNRGMKAPRAAYQGTRQVFGAIVASTLTTVCVFLPLIFTTGLVRQMMLPFALTLTFALFASLLVAITVVPTLCSLLMKKAKPRKPGLLDKLQKIYAKALQFCLRVKIVPLALAILMLVLSVAGILKQGVVLMPDMVSDNVAVTATITKEDVTKDEAFAIADEVMAAAVSIDGIAITGGMSNAEALFSGMSSGDYTTFMFYMVPDESVKTESNMKAIVAEMEEKVAGIEGAEIEVSASAMGSFSTMLGSGLSLKIYGDELDEMLKVSEDFVEILDNTEGFVNASNGQEEAPETLHLIIDKAAAMRNGLTVAQIYQDIAGNLTTEKTAMSLKMDGENYDVKIVNETKKPFKETLLDKTFEVKVMNDEGEEETETHALSEYATLETEAGYSTISRENNERYITVSAETEEGYNLTLLTNKVKDQFEAYDMPDGCRYDIGGEYENVVKMLSQVMLLAALGLLFIYLVMVAQFQSLLSPFIILFTIPLAFTGGFLGLLVAREQLSMMSLMGLLILMGTVVNNGIVFVDYTNQLRIGGMKKRDALVAAGKTRMRPILMTALTTILSMAALIFDRSTSAGMGRGMAIVVAAGLLYATLMTLFVVPVLYDMMYRKKPKVVDVGDESMDDVPDDAAEFMEELRRTEREDADKSAFENGAAKDRSVDDFDLDDEADSAAEADGDDDADRDGDLMSLGK